MTYSRLIIGDANVARFWQASQLARPQLVGVPLKTASCLDTFATSLSDVTDAIDYVVISVITSLLLDEVSSTDVANSSHNVFQSAFQHVEASAKRASRVEVRSILFCITNHFFS